MNSVKDKWRWLNRKYEHFKDFGYQLEIDTNLKLANSEPIPGSAPKTCKQIQ
jgi:hypothetical protein